MCIIGLTIISLLRKTFAEVKSRGPHDCQVRMKYLSSHNSPWDVLDKPGRPKSVDDAHMNTISCEEMWYSQGFGRAKCCDNLSRLLIPACVWKSVAENLTRTPQFEAFNEINEGDVTNQKHGLKLILFSLHKFKFQWRTLFVASMQDNDWRRWRKGKEVQSLPFLGKPHTQNLRKCSPGSKAPGNGKRHLLTKNRKEDKFKRSKTNIHWKAVSRQNHFTILHSTRTLLCSSRITQTTTCSIFSVRHEVHFVFQMTHYFAQSVILPWSWMNKLSLGPEAGSCRVQAPHRGKRRMPMLLDDSNKTVHCPRPFCKQSVYGVFRLGTDCQHRQWLTLQKFLLIHQ